MAAGKKTGGGSRKGKPNRSTAAAREAIGKFVDANAHKLQEWLDKVAKTDPEKAFNMFTALVEFHVPKLARTEHTGKDGEDMRFVVTQGHVRGL